jgi:hypothetical protein
MTNTINIKEINEQINERIDKNLKLLEDSKDYKDIKEKLDKGNNFIDYFLVIGQEPIIYREKWLYTEDLDTLNKKHKEQFKPKIISSFPPFEKSTIAFDESILMHIFPNGYKLIRARQKPKSKVFSFILDNNYYNLDYPQKYLTCLICYESIAQYKILQELENNEMDYTKIDKKKINSQPYADIYIPKCILIMSLYPFFGEFEKIITEIYSYSQNLVFKAIDLSSQTVKSLSERKVSYRRMSTFTEVIKEKLPEVPIEKIVENLLIELPVPPRGVAKVTYYLNEEERIIIQNKMNELPLLDINLKKIFVDFQVKDVINIYNYIFLESRILFFSRNIEYLNNFIYGLLALLYPFQYQYQIVTILPQINFEIIESPTPFIAGINQSFHDKFFDEHNFILEDSILVVDIDNKKVNVINEKTKIPEFPSKYRKNFEKKLQEIVNKYLKKYKTEKVDKHPRKSKLINLTHTEIRKDGASLSGGTSSTTDTVESSKSAIFNQIDTINHINSMEEDVDMDEINNTGNEIDEKTEMLNNLNIGYDFNQEISDIFFNFNANLLSNYNQFLNRDFYSSNTMPSLEMLFKVNEYLKTISQADKKFYEKFIEETQIFGDFIYLRMVPKNSKEKIRILKFDEKINENSNNSRYSKIGGVFTNTKEYEFVNTSAILKPRPLSKHELDFYKIKKHRTRLLTYGVEIKYEKDLNKAYFNYPIFPKLTNLLFLAENIKDYFPPQNFNEELDIINDDIISKSHLADVSIRLDDMKKYIYLCWIQLWALTFWYNQENEKKYRFQELIKIIEKSSCYEMEIFNLLFEVLSKYGKDTMVLKLYDVLLKKKLNPSFKVHNIVMKIMEGKKMEGNFAENLKKIIEKEDKIIYTKNNFNRRTFRSKYFSNILTENIKFYAFDSCIMCQKDINLELISKNLKEMKRDLNWTVCPGCGENILPKLTVQFGEEINKSGDMKKNTCIIENIVLFSPYILKNNYNTFFKKNEMKIDVEKFMMNYSTIFWDSLWYFKLNNLEYDFMQPYYYRLEEIKSYPEFEISLEDLNDKNILKDNIIVDKYKFDSNKLQICNFNFIL